MLLQLCQLRKESYETGTLSTQPLGMQNTKTTVCKGHPGVTRATLMVVTAWNIEKTRSVFENERGGSGREDILGRRSERVMHLIFLVNSVWMTARHEKNYKAKLGALIYITLEVTLLEEDVANYCHSSCRFPLWARLLSASTGGATIQQPTFQPVCIW